MKRLHFFYFLLLSVIIMSSCNKKTDNNGFITGFFTGTYFDYSWNFQDRVCATGNIRIKLTFSGEDRYSCTSLDSTCLKPFSAYDANAGHGTYKILNDTQIQFKDESVLTADFDWTLMLNGTYNYTYDAAYKKLTLTRGSAVYEMSDCALDTHDATVIYTGLVAADGCDWMIQMDDSTFYHPDNLPAAFMVNEKQVRIRYSVTTERFICGMTTLSYPVIHLNSIEDHP